ncbi:DNA-binding MarR family transcriptional regulator [Hamadaea flava]|uniref:MarR family winged helix-turn-helix transcriptional regulator n=1 Tax=Hamadaea flava TaxID=1742688 RepID=A0ABV8LY58_9ACTN|nr:MarR family winged helix-turn-helix transcriptional regulator [Hamadaea flava]MCP2329278.1 DNA-binding MarR family transcriptional regulator [Hamadaea flava]
MPEPRWLDQEEMRAWMGYRRMRLLLDLQVNRELMAQHGLSEPDYDVLSNLSEAGDDGMRLSELAAYMRWSKSRLSHHITRMQERGLVERRECADDGRGSLLHLTTHGAKMIRNAAPDHVDSVRRHFIDLLTREDIEVFGKISRRVLDHLREIELNH